MPSLRPDALTWTGLLGQWVRFAQAALALPEVAHGPRWRASGPAIIKLQAVTFALADLDRLAPNERPLALDKAEMLINEGAAQLQLIWQGMEMSAMLREIISDAQAALRAAK